MTIISHISRAPTISDCCASTPRTLSLAGTPGHTRGLQPGHRQADVGLARSHHYSHSTYVDLILSGLIGIRPHADDVLEVNPLLTADTPAGAQPIHYFAVQGVLYHGHDVSVIYDADGSRYGIGSGLSVFRGSDVLASDLGAPGLAANLGTYVAAATYARFCCSNLGALTVRGPRTRCHHENREAAADSVSAAIGIVDYAHIMAVIQNSLHGKIMNGLCACRRVGSKQRIHFQHIVGVRPDADQAAENQIDIGRVAVVVRAREADNRLAGVRL